MTLLVIRVSLFHNTLPFFLIFLENVTLFSEALLTPQRMKVKNVCKD